MSDFAYHASARASALSGIIGWVARGIESVISFVNASAERQESVQHVQALLKLKDWQLDDMGLSRADVHNALDAHDPRIALQGIRSANSARTFRALRRR
ncbi:MAG: hypothetical protein AAF619_01975 [Pseudomonadota bacterium]